MAAQDLVDVAFGTEAGHGITFLARSSCHGVPRHANRLKDYMIQRDLPLLGKFQGENGSPACYVVLLQNIMRPWTASTCSAVENSLHDPPCADLVKKLHDPDINQQLSQVLSFCQQLFGDQELATSGLDTSTFPPVPSVSLPSTTSSYPAGSITKVDTPIPSQGQTGTTTLVPLSQSATTVPTIDGVSPALSISRGGLDLKGSGISDSRPLQASDSTIALKISGSSAYPVPYLSSSITESTLFPSPLPGGPSTGVSPISPGNPHRPNIGAIIGIAIGALAVILFIVLALSIFFRFRRRAGRRTRRTSSGSPWQRLEPYVYESDGASSRPGSSMWTWFGSIPVDLDYNKPEPQGEPSPRSLSSFRFTEKDTPDGTGSAGWLEAHTMGPSPCTSPVPSETQSLAQDMASVQSKSLDEGPPYLTAPAPSALGASSSSSQLLALAGSEFVIVNASNRGERIASRVSCTTASSGDVQSMEAM